MVEILKRQQTKAKILIHDQRCRIIPGLIVISSGRKRDTPPTLIVSEKNRESIEKSHIQNSKNGVREKKRDRKNHRDAKTDTRGIPVRHHLLNHRVVAVAARRILAARLHPIGEKINPDPALQRRIVSLQIVCECAMKYSFYFSG